MIFELYYSHMVRIKKGHLCTSMYNNIKDIFMLDLMESTKLGSPLKRMLNEFFQTDTFFQLRTTLLVI